MENPGQFCAEIHKGTSFCGPARPRLAQEASLPERFNEALAGLADRIVRETDIVTYLTEVQNYTIETLPRSRNDVSEDVRDNLHRRCWPVTEFNHIPTGSEFGYEEYSRLRLGGFDIRAEEPSSLLPRLRIARVYWPRQALCLPAWVPSTRLQEVRTKLLTKAQMAGAKELFPPFNVGDEVIQSDAEENFRNHLEHALWREALSSAGFDPDNMDWSSFEDPVDGSARNGAEWRTYWQAMSVDLHLVADGHVDALRFGFTFRGGSIGHWTDAGRDLLHPSYDDFPGSRLECSIFDEPFDLVPWFPDGDRMLVCRGLTHARKGPAFDQYGEVDVEEFEDLDVQVLHDMSARPIWSAFMRESWELLTKPMQQASKPSYDIGGERKNTGQAPRLRPLFDAPDGWTPAPDGSLASAILRGLAYGEGPARLDDLFIGQVNNLVRCFRDMKTELSHGYESAMKQRGYQPES